MAVPVENLLETRYADLQETDLLSGRQIPAREVTVDRAYVSFYPIGISLVLPDGETIEEIQLHAEGHEGFGGFKGPLPGGIDFSMSRPQVRALLGFPAESGERANVFPLGMMPPWDSFLTPTLRIHVEYNLHGEGNRMISLTRRQEHRSAGQACAANDSR